MENFIGSNVFFGIISAYLVKYSYSNAETKDLFEMFRDPFNKIYDNIHNIMDTWTRQEGFPVVNVRKSGKNTYVLTQKRFLADPDAVSDPSKSKFG